MRWLLIGVALCGAVPALASEFPPELGSFAYPVSHDDSASLFPFDYDTALPPPPAKPQPEPAAAAAPGAAPSRPLFSKTELCSTVAFEAAINKIPVRFFANLIEQESSFNPRVVSYKGAQGIAQFMPGTAAEQGLADPFEPIQALSASAKFVAYLLERFGNLGLAAAAYNAGPGRVSAWLTSHRPLPGETRNYVAIITGWTADEWASATPPKTSETTIPQGVPCTRLANLILAPKEEAQRMAAYVPRWGMQLTANWSESKAWATYRTIQKQYAALIGDREPIVIRSRGIGLGTAMRFNIRIADDDRTYLEKFCQKLIAAGGACVVLRNDRG